LARTEWPLPSREARALTSKVSVFSAAWTAPGKRVPDAAANTAPQRIIALQLVKLPDEVFFTQNFPKMVN
jgi:hypothetical protein